MDTPELKREDLEFLAHLPMLLNSSFSIEQIIKSAVQEVRKILKAEAATVFLLNRSGTELTFWASRGGNDDKIEGRKMPASKGIVGWVIANRKPLIVNDAARDERFFPTIDREGAFQTRSLLTLPLIVKEREVIGVLQMLNKEAGAEFTEEDLTFAEQFSHQAALAIANALLYQELQVRNRQLEVMNRRKNDVMTVINHEFRTPLNLIQNSAGLLTTGTLTEAHRERMSRTLTTAIDRLHRLVRQIRDASTLTESDLPLSRNPVDVHELFADLASQYDEILKKRKLSLQVKAERTIPMVNADALLLLVAMKNLLANAIRFTADGGQITLGARTEADLIHLSVSDTGIGIETGDLPLIFEKFYEVTDAMNHTSGEFEFRSCGLGLGLPTVRGILTAHGAEIHVDSTPGKGTTFSFSLPAESRSN